MFRTTFSIPINTALPKLQHVINNHHVMLVILQLPFSTSAFSYRTYAHVSDYTINLFLSLTN